MHLSGKKLLIIDDELAIRRSLGTYFSDVGMEIILADDGEEGLRLFQENGADAVLLDIWMPGLDGIETLSKFRKIAADLPVIIISGAGVMQDAISALRLGAWDYIPKPIRDIGVVEHSLLRALESVHLKQENQRYHDQLKDEVALRSSELAQSERRYANLVKNLPGCMILVFDETMRYILADGMALVETGLGPDFLIGKTPHEAFGKQLGDRITTIFHETLDGNSGRHELVYWDQVWEVRTVPLRDETGKVTAGMTVSVNITRHKRTEEELRRSREHFYNIINNTTDAILELDLHFIITAMNKKAEAVFARSRNDTLGMNLPSIFPEFKESGTLDLFRQSFTDQQVVDREEYVPRLSAWFEMHAYPTKESLFIYFRDITERKQAEQRIRESEERFELAVSGSEGGLWDFEFDRKNPDVIRDEIYLSPQLKAIAGYEDHEFPNSLSAWRSIVHPDDMPPLNESTHDHLLGRIALLDAEFRIYHKDGSIRWLSSRGRIHRDDTGRAVRWTGIDWDITEKKKAERALSQSEKKYRMLYEQAAEGIILADDKMNIFDANPRALEMLGYGKQELTSLKYHDLLDPSDIDKIPVRLKAVLKGQTVRLERRMLTSEGHILHVDISTSPMGDDLIQIMMRDMSQRKQMEKDLIRAKRFAEEANEAKGLFLANMSHEIRTPISGILGMTEMLLSMNPPEAHSEYLGLIKTSARSLLGIINDILDFSKIEAQKMELSKEDFDVRPALETVLEPFHVEAQQKNLALTMIIHENVPERLRGDSCRLGQILRNLVSNSVKFTDEGSVTVKVKTVESTESGETLRFSITDTGPGIPTDKTDDLFESFSQLDGSLAKKHQGTGLGLAISKELTEMMGGRIWLESQEGIGSTFYFTAELEHAKSEAIEETQNELDIATKTLANVPPLTILLAEDNEINQIFLIHFLASAGHTVITARDGKEAVMAFEANDFDIVLMDVQMPVMDGIEATRLLRKQGVSIPIIALTAFTMIGDKERFIKAGMSHYLSKPIEMKELAALLSQLV